MEKLNINLRRICDHYLYTNRFGDWAFLDEKQHNLMQKKKKSPSLLKNTKIEALLNPSKRSLERYYQKIRRYEFRNTSLHIIHLTRRCNQKCRYCHSSVKSIKSKDSDLDIKTARKIVDFIFQTPEKSISIEFQGGEPVLNFKVLRFIVGYSQKINKKYKKKIRYCLTTNLTALNDEIVNFFIDNNISFGSSLDGPKEVNDKMRVFENGNGTYEEVMKKTEELKKKYNIKPHFILVTSKESLNNYKEIIDEYVRLEQPEIQLVKNISYTGYGKRCAGKEGLNLKQFKEFWTKSCDYIIELNKKGINIKPRIGGEFVKKIMRNNPTNLTEYRSPCGMIRGQLNYSIDGSIYCCDTAQNFERFKIGDVFRDNYQEVINSEKSKELIDKSRLNFPQCLKCVYRSWCGICVVETYSKTGSTNIKKDDEWCQRNKIMFDYIFRKILTDKEAGRIIKRWA